MTAPAAPPPCDRHLPEPPCCSSRKAALALAGGRRLWRCSDKGGCVQRLSPGPRGKCAISFTPTHAESAGRSRCRCHGRASPNDQWSVHRWRPRVTGLAQASSLLGRPVKDFSASRFRQPPHRAPAGGARCDRGSPPAPRHVHAARDRAPARSGDAERHVALAPASPSDRRRARDSTEARGMDALALAISANRRHPRRPEPRAGRASPCVQLGCAAVASGDVAKGSGASRLMTGGARRRRCRTRVLARAWPFRSCGRSGVRRVAAPPCAAARRSNVAAPPCPAMPSRHVRCLPDQRNPQRDG